MPEAAVGRVMSFGRVEQPGRSGCSEGSDEEAMLYHWGSLD